MDYIAASKKVVHWALAIVAIVLLVSGLGITEYRTVESLTGGLLNKSNSYIIHINSWIPFLFLFILHISLTAYTNLRRKRGLVNKKSD